MGPVEEAIRSTYGAPTKLHTISQQAPFVLEKMARTQIVLLLGAKRNWTPLRWEWLETVASLPSRSIVGSSRWRP